MSAPTTRPTTKSYWVYGPPASGKTHWVQQQGGVQWIWRDHKTAVPENFEPVTAIVIDGPENVSLDRIRMFASNDAFVIGQREDARGNRFVMAARPKFFYMTSDKSLAETWKDPEKLEEMKGVFEEIDVSGLRCQQT